MATDLAVFLKYANVQMAAEAVRLVEGMSGNALEDALKAGNNRASKFPPTLAHEFAANWSVVSVQTDTSSGFSGTLFKYTGETDDVAGLVKGELVLSFRSTEFADDAVRDNQSTNSFEVRKDGWAFGQIADMENWFDQLRVSQKIPDGAQIAVTGYSLGGHLATAFNVLRQEQGEAGLISGTYTFNGAGVGNVRGGKTLTQVIDGFRSSLASPVTLLDGLILAAPPEVAEAYRTLGSKYSGRIHDIPSLLELSYLSALNELYKGAAQPLLEAVTRVRAVMTETERVRTISNSQTPIQVVELADIEASDLLYQLAVMTAAQDTRGYPVLNLGDPESGFWSSILDRRVSSLDSYSGMHDIYASNYPSAVANSQLHYGLATPVRVEDQPLHRGVYGTAAIGSSLWNWDVKLLVDNFSENDFGDTHSLALLVDSLAVQNAFATLDSTFTAAKGLALIDVSTNAAARSVPLSQGYAEGDALENLITSLASQLGVTIAPLSGSRDGNTWYEIEDKNGDTGRGTFHEALAAVVKSGAFQSLTGKVTITPVGENVANQAKARVGFETIASLQSLSSFTLNAIGEDGRAALESVWQSQAWGGQYFGWLADKAALANGDEPANFSDSWIADRSAMLGAIERRNKRNTDKAIGLTNTDYYDLGSNTRIYQRINGVGTNSPANVFSFGGDADDIINGTDNALGDHLYGGAGEDFIDGKDGDDYIEGNAGIDDLYGGNGRDTLVGGAGDDYLSGEGGDDILRGGAGEDTYHFDDAFGKDSVTDSDGQGSILIDTKALSAFKGAGRRGGYAFDMGGGQYAGLAVIDSSSSSTGYKAVIVKGTDTANTITINNFDPAKALDGGYLGIELDALPEVALVKGGGGNFWRDINADTDSLQVAPSTVTQGAGVTFTISLSQDAKAGDSLLLNLVGLAGKGLKAILGDETVDADGAEIVLAEGQTLVTFALVQEGDLDEDTEGSLSVTYQGDDGTAISNSWGLRLDASDEPDSTITGDGLVKTETNGDYPITRFALDGTELTVVEPKELYFVKDANNNLVEGTSDPTLVPIYNEAQEVVGYKEIASDDIEVTEDTLYGTAGKDKIDGKTGNDLIAGKAGDDQIDAGAGDDMIGGGAGNDRILGGDGDDYISSSADILPDRQQFGPLDRWVDWGQPANSETVALGAMWGMYPDASDAAVDVWNGMMETRTDAQSDSIDAGDGDDRVIASWGDDRVQGGAGDDRIEGLAGDDILEGGDGDDVLDGDGLVKAGYLNSVDASRHGSDFIDGGAGDDEINGGGGSDNIFGGEGDDRIFADGGGDSDSQTFVDLQFQGEDYIDGEDGDDVVEGGGKDDVVYGGAGEDVLWGDTSAEHLKEAAATDPNAWGDDYLDGEDGDDLLYGGGGDDTLYGGMGDDQLAGDDGPALAASMHGNDYLDGEDGDDTLFGGGKDDTLFGGDGDDTLQGDLADLDGEFHGDDYLDGEEGDDALFGQGGADQLYGGAGDDELQGDGDEVAEQYQGADLLDGGDGDDRLFGGGGDDSLIGGAGADQLSGDDGNDLLLGGEGADVLVGGNDDDTLQGGEGDDSIYGGDGSDQIAGGAGNDNLNSGDGDDTLDGGAGNDRFGIFGTHGNKVLMDESGTETLDLGWGVGETELGRGSLLLRNTTTGQEVHIEGFDADDAASVSAIENFVFSTEDGQSVVLTAQEMIQQIGFAGHGTNGDDLLSGTAFNDILDGGAGDDVLAGNEGNDRLTGGLGADQLLGGQGNDVYVMDGQGEDQVIEFEGEGQDTIAASIDYVLTAANVETVLLTGNQAINATGNDEANHLVGNAGANVLDGAAGADVLEGGAGDDTYRVDDGGDMVIEKSGQGTDTVIAALDYVLPDHVENVVLAGDAESATGNNANNRLQGNDADNRLRGLDGNDRIEGGAGDDVYVVRGDGGVKTIMDDGGDADVLDLGWEAYATHFVLGSKADNLGVYNAVTGQLVEIEGFDVLDHDATSSVESMILTVHELGFVYEKGFGIDDLFRRQGLSFFGTDGDDTLSGTWRRDRLWGFGGNDSLLGTDGDDTLEGGVGLDVMTGGAGDDVYIVENPSDTVEELAGQGFDTVLAESDFSIQGTDVEWLEMTDADHHTGVGNDLRNYLYSSVSGSSLFGEGGNDEMFGRNGGDSLHGGAGNDHILGREGDDLLAGDDGDDELRADEGNDVLVGGAGNDRLYGDKGSDRLDGSAGDDSLWGAEGDDILQGGDGNDMLRGEDGQDQLFGGNGDDTLLNSPGGDTLAGGNGDDIYREDTVNGLLFGFAASGTELFEAEDGGTDTVDVYESFTLGDNFENLRLRHLPDGAEMVGTGNALVNRLESLGTGSVTQLFGLGGDDVLVGGGGTNRLDGGTGADLMIGGTGDTEYAVDDANDRVVALAQGGHDTVRSTINFTLGEFMEDLVLEEGSATLGGGNDLPNEITGNSNDNILDGGGGADVLRGGGGDDILLGTQGQDYLFGDDGRDQLFGSDTSNLLNGGNGADLMVGGKGDDSYVVDDVDDVLVEDAEAGTDSVFAVIDYTLQGDFENLAMLGYGLTGIGNSLDNVILGREGGESLYGLDGDDLLDAGAGIGVLLDGGAGRDTLISTRGSASLVGGEGDDLYKVSTGDVSLVEYAGGGYDRVLLDAGPFQTVGLYLAENVEELDASASGGNLYIQASGDDNLILGGAGNDQISGGSGNDRIDGGQSRSAVIPEPYGFGIAGAMDALFRLGPPAPRTFDRLLADFSSDISQDSSGLYEPSAYTAFKVPASPDEVLEPVPLYVSYWLGQTDPSQVLYIHPDGSLTWEGGGFIQESLLATWQPRSAPLDWDGLQAQYGLRTTVPAGERDAYFAVSGIGIPSPEQHEGGPGGNTFATVYWPRDRLPADMQATLAQQLEFGDGHDGRALAYALASSGVDSLDGGDGNDMLDGGDGNDLLFGGAGEDVLIGGADNTGPIEVSVVGSLEGGYINVVLASAMSTNDDVLDGGAGLDVLVGGSGDDTYYVDGESTPNPDGRIASFDWCDVDHRFGMDGAALDNWVADTVVEAQGQGNDKVIASASVVLSNIETVELSDSAPTLDIDAATDAGSQTLLGNSGRNTLDGGTGADILAGGAGDDTYVVDDAGDAVIEAADAGQDIVRTTVDQYVLGDNVEALLLDGGQDLVAFGNAASNILIGNTGDNTLDGGSGDDMLAGWRGDDLLLGGEGFDTYFFSRGDGHDTVDDNAGGQLHFSGDIRAEELSYRTDANDLLIRLGESDASNGVQVTVRGWLDGSAERVSQISFCTDSVVAPLDDFVLMKPQGDVFTVAQGAAGVVGNLLDNDADRVFRDRVSLSPPTAWAGELGTASASQDGSFAYTLHTASLEFKALGQGQSFTDSLGLYSTFDTVTGRWLGDSAVQVEVLGVNDGPVAQADIAAVSEDDVLSAWGNVLANDSDVDAGDTLTVSDAGTRAGQYGTLVLDSQGAYTYSLANSSPAVQALSAGQKVSEVFAYTVADPHGAAATAQLSVEIAGRNEAAGVTLTGTNRNDRLIGTDYADVIDGGKGADTLVGGKGDDTYFVDASSAACSDGDDRDDDHGDGHGAGRDDDHEDERDASSGDTVVELRNGGVDTVAASVNYVLPQNVENLMLLGSASLVASGNGQANVIVGSGGASTLSGGGGNDVLVGRSASDTLNGGSGDDKLYGEGGNDKLSAGDGADQVWGGTGNDVLDAGGGDNLIAAGAGDDIVTGGSGSDVVVAGAGADRIATGAGNDVVDGGTGNDTIDTGNGSDFIAAGKGADVVTAGAGRDVIAFNRGDGQDTLLATSGSGAADVLSLGGGIRYADLTLTRRGTDLILGLGAADQVTSKNWYTGQDSKTISTLQVVTVGGDYNAASTNKLVDNKVVAFDFTAITQQYDAARKANASLGAWALQPALSSAFIGASNTSALGGDLAFDYATTYTATQGYGTDMTVDAVRKEAKEQTGNNWQSVTTLPGAQPGPTVVDPWVALQAGTDLVVSQEAGASNPITPTSSPATDSLLLAALAASTDVQQPSWAVK